MVARLFRLRVALLGGTFRGSLGKGFRALVRLLLLAAIAGAFAYAPVRFIADDGARAIVDIVLGSLILAAIFAVPLFENRLNLEPRQFAHFPASHASVASALLLSTVLTWPFIIFIGWLTALGLLRDSWRDPAWLLPVGIALTALFAVCSVRVVSLLSRLAAGTRHAGALRTIGVILLIAALPLAVFVGATAFGAGGISTLAEAARTLSWTPFGAPFAAFELAAAGDVAAALVRLGVLAGATLLLLIIWYPLVRRSNRTIERPLDSGVARTGLGWFERFPARPAQVIAARQVTYWARDPRYRVALFAIPFAPIVMLLAFWVAGADLRVLALVPLPIVLLLFGWSQHNDVAMDSTAIWQHVASGTRGRADRAGRLAPILMLGIPTAIIGSSVTVTLIEEWRILPAVIGMNIAVLLVASASASVFSVTMPYPATRPGDSPFVQPQWSGSGSALAQTLSMVFAIVLALPPVWFAMQAIVDVTFIQNVWALLFGVGYGLAVLGLGILIGGLVFDRSGPELIAVTQVYD